MVEDSTMDFAKIEEIIRFGRAVSVLYDKIIVFRTQDRLEVKLHAQ